jgi:alkylation response protein AidB-like acyl-CoA dehydrogenase
MDFNFTELQTAWQNKAKKFAREKIAPHVNQLETDFAFRHELFQEMAREDFYTFAITPTEEGMVLAYLLALKEIAKVDAGIAVTMAVTSMVAEAIWRHGNIEQQEHYLPFISEGICVPASFAVTEKDAGSDVKRIQTSACIDPDNSNYYVLNGEKQYITNADSAGVLLVIARTDLSPSADHEAHVMSAFLVDKGTPGLTFPKVEGKMGLLTANLVSVKFSGCRIDKSRLLGKEGDGLKIALGSLDSGRLSVAAQAIGIAEAAYEGAVAFAKQREQFGGPISAQQNISFNLADMRVKLDAAELLLFKAAWLRTKKAHFTAEAAIAKLFASEAANWIAYEALQIHGGFGYTKDCPAEKYFRDARVTTLYEGTSEIQRVIIAREILTTH